VAGWDGATPGIAVTTWEHVEWGTQVLEQMVALATKDDTQLCAYRRRTSTGPNKWAIEVARIARDGTTSQIVIASSLSHTNYYPTLLQLPDGRINVYFWYYETIRTRWNIRAYTSTDDGATWTLLSDGVLKDAWTSTLGTYSGTVNYEAAAGAAPGYSDNGKLAVAYHNGSVLLMAGITLADTALTNRNVMRQWASSDLGCTFELVESDSAETDVATKREKAPILLQQGDEIYLIYIGGDKELFWKILSNAWQPTSEITEDSLAYDDIVQYVAACIDDGGTVWIYPQHDMTNTNGAYTAPCRGAVASSTNRMRDVIPHGISSYPTLWWDGYETTSPTDGGILDVSACFARGQTCMFHRHNSNASTRDDSLSVAYLGGWSTVQLPGFYPTVNSAQTRTAWQIPWWPGMGLPDTDSRFGTGGTGGGTSVISANADVQIDTTAHTRYYTAALNDNQITAQFSMRAVTAPGTLGEIGVKVQCYDGVANNHTCQLWLSATQMIVRNVNGGGSTLATVTGISLAIGLHIRISVNDSGGVSVWYIQGAITGDQEWIEAYSSTSGLTSAAGGSSYAWWGNLVSGPATQSQWQLALFNSDDNIGAVGKLANGFSNPADCFGAQVSKRATYYADGLRLSGTVGPAIYGDKWSIPTRHAYAVANLFSEISPSPDQKWRSTTTAANNIAVDCGGGVSSDRALLSPLVAMYVKGINWRTGTFQAYDQGVGWVNLVTLDAATEFSTLAYARHGSSVVPNSIVIPAPSRYIAPGELVGCTVNLGSGKFRKVKTNTGGYWTSSTSVASVQLLLEGIDNTEPASGTCDIWYTELLAVAYTTAKRRAYRIIVQSQTTADGYLEIGQAVVGPFYAFATDYSYGHTRSQSANIAVTETADRRKRRQRLGGQQRSISMAWTDPVDEQKLNQGDADYIRSESGGRALAHVGDTAQLIQGIHAHIDGEMEPLVYVAELDYDQSTWQITDRRLCLYGAMIGDVETTNVWGEEHEQVVQVQTIIIEEEV